MIGAINSPRALRQVFCRPEKKNVDKTNQRQEARMCWALHTSAQPNLLPKTCQAPLMLMLEGCKVLSAFLSAANKQVGKSANLN